MYLIRKVLILVSFSFLALGIYYLFEDGWSWNDNKGAWLISISAVCVIVSQIGSYFYDLRDEQNESHIEN